MKAIIPRRDETTIEIDETSTLIIRQVDQGGESHVIMFALDDAETLASEVRQLVAKYRKPFFQDGKFTHSDNLQYTSTSTVPTKSEPKRKGSI